MLRTGFHNHEPVSETEHTLGPLEGPSIEALRDLIMMTKLNTTILA